MYCENCGALIRNESARFCSNCGCRLQQNAAQAVPQPPSVNRAIAVGQPGTVPRAGVRQGRGAGRLNYSCEEHIRDNVAIVKTHAAFVLIDFYVFAGNFSRYIEFEESLSGEMTKEQVEEYWEIVDELMQVLESVDVHAFMQTIDFSSFQEYSTTIIGSLNTYLEEICKSDPRLQSTLRDFFLPDSAFTRFADEVHRVVQQEMSGKYARIVSLISSLQNRRQIWEDFRRPSGVDAVSNAAQYFAGGVLAAAMPWIGIPALIAKYGSQISSDKKVEKARGDFLSDVYALKTAVVEGFSARDHCISRLQSLIGEKMQAAYQHINAAVLSVLSEREAVLLYDKVIQEEAEAMIPENEESRHVLNYLLDYFFEEDISPYYESLVRKALNIHQ